MTETSFPKYEIMLVLQPDLGEEKTKTLLEEMKVLIKEAGGKIFHEDMWGLRELTYMIKKQKQGYYAVYDFTANPAKVKEFEKQLNIYPGVLRYLIQKTPKNYEIKTFAEYEVEAVEAAKVKEEAKAKSDQAETDRRGGGRSFERREKPTPVVAKPFVKKEAPAVEEEDKDDKKTVKKVKKEEAVEEKPKAKKPAAVTLEDVDAKLKSIIDDPDITL
jgi:small subunit ribosomal protein S6